MTSSKERIMSGFAEFAAGNIEVLQTLLREDFIEHSPGNPSGRRAFIDFIKNSALTSSRFELKRVVAEGDLVVMHYHLIPREGGRGLAVVDFWRLEDGLIAEHWDVVQPVPEPEEVPHGMF
jgi:predicted SnoaL-like aldol condensation-catalyzing enzyme